MGSDCWDAERFAGTARPPRDNRLQLRTEFDCCCTNMGFPGFPGGLKARRDPLFCIVGCYHRCARCASALLVRRPEGSSCAFSDAQRRDVGFSGGLVLLKDQLWPLSI